jgi:ribosomal protein L40E
VILDHAGNFFRHGFPCQDRHWSLESKKREPSAGAFRRCPKCYFTMPPGTPVCEKCGYKFPLETRESRDLVHDEGSLVRFDPRAMRQQTLGRFQRDRDEAMACESFAELVALAKIRKYPNPNRWALHTWRRIGRNICRFCGGTVEGRAGFCSGDCRSQMRAQRKEWLQEERA